MVESIKLREFEVSLLHMGGYKNHRTTCAVCGAPIKYNNKSGLCRYHSTLKNQKLRWKNFNKNNGEEK